MSKNAGRKPGPAAPVSRDTLNMQTAAADTAALDVLVPRLQEISERFGDGQPYERNRVVSETQFFFGQSALAMLEMGKRLVLIKENEQHGDFLQIVVERLGLKQRTAQQMMQAAVKYLAPAVASNTRSPALLGLGKAKLLDLLAESDDDIQELAAGGTVAGLDLDDMRCMNSKELRSALSEARKAKAAKDQVIQRLSQENADLKEAEELRRSAKPSERETAQLDDVRKLGLAAETVIQQLVAGCAAVNDAPATESAAVAARHAVEFVAQVFADAINERGLPVDFVEKVIPHWLEGIDKPAATNPATA